jgi:hypothetical protein
MKNTLFGQYKFCELNWLQSHTTFAGKATLKFGAADKKNSDDYE